jgi:hypothetical protein
MATTIAERVKLLDIAKIEKGLLLHPASQSAVERSVAERIERTEWQRVGLAHVMDGQNLRPLVHDRYDRGAQPNAYHVPGSSRPHS